MIGLIVFLLFVAFLLQVDFIFYIAYVCIGIYAWSRWVTPRQLKSLRISRSYAPYAFWGEQIPITIHIKNASRLPIPWVNVQDSIAIELFHQERLNEIITLKGREETERTYHIRGTRRGYYKVGPMRLITRDLFGLVSEQIGSFPTEYITIYPRIIPLSKLGLPSRLPFGTLAGKQRLFADPARPMGVRHFRSGDSLRQINWKASGHTQRLMVKTYQPAISLETAVLLNLHSSDYERRNRLTSVEWAIEVAASLAAHLVNVRQPVGLISNGIDPLFLSSRDGNPVFDAESGRLLIQDLAARRGQPESLLSPAIPPGASRAHLIKVLERLARLETEETVPLSLLATNATTRLSWGVTILTITPKGDLTTCQIMHRLVRNGFNPVLITIEPDRNFSQVRERARRLGFAAFNIVTERDLDLWRQPTGAPV